MKRFLKNNRSFLLLLSLVFTVMACSGGGCSACESCGIAPIPGGYPISERIPNATQVRLTEGGINFLENNIDSLITLALPDGLEFPIPPVRTSQSIIGINIDIDVCQGGNCNIRGEITGFTLTPVAPNRLSGNIRVILDSRNDAGARAGLPIKLRGGCVFGICAVDTTCQADIDTRPGSRNDVSLNFDIDFVEETQAARAGYTKIVVSNASLGDGLEDSDVSLGSCSGISGAIINFLSGLLTGLIVDQLQSQVDGLIGDTINDQLCQTASTDFTPACPTGTFNVDGTCRFGPSGSDECVPILLGMDGQGDLGAQLIGGFSPGAHATGQFLLASGGEGEAVNNGMSLFMYGGFLSTSRDFMSSPGHNPCVPIIDPPALPTIPRVATFRGNDIPGMPGSDPHVGIGISEQFLNHAGYGMFDSGMLCLGAGTRLSQLLSTGLFSLLIPSIRNITFPEQSAALAVNLRPQKPPTFEVGAGGDSGEAVLTVTLDDLQVDFYVWSNDRYVRFMTYQSDLSIPINLKVDGGQIVPEISEILAENSEVTNSDLLDEDPVALAGVIEDVLTMFAGMITGSLGGFDLPEIMGLNLDIPPGGIRGIEEGGDEFLSIFAQLSVAGSGGGGEGEAAIAPVETRMEISDLRLTPEGMGLEAWGEGDLPRFHLWFDGGSSDGNALEYSYRIDHGQWSDWTTETHVWVESRNLLFQGKHRVETRARVVGMPETVSATPATSTVIVDIVAPEVTTTEVEGGLRVEGFDIVTEEEDLEYRVRIGDAEWTDWQRLTPDLLLDVDVTTSDVEVEVRDEAGNIGSAREALIRGVPNPDGGGCACTVVSEDDHTPLAALAALVLFGLVQVQRRRWQKGRSTRALLKKVAKVARHFTTLVVILGLPTAFGIAGCDCGGNTTPPPPDGGTDTTPPPMGCDCVDGESLCCEATMMCVAYTAEDLCDPGFACAEGAASIDAACTVTCGTCERLPPLNPGHLATYLDMVAMDDGSLVLSGYSPGNPPRTAYGDLVVGVYDSASETVSWEIVDGVPDAPIQADPDGWRGGIRLPGDNVGRWTSIDGAGGTTVHVSYEDVDNRDLKFASGGPGAPDGWGVHTVDSEGFAGQHTSILHTADGRPVIAYMSVVEPAALPGKPVGRARVAMANNSNPTAGTDWTFTNVHETEINCRPQFCPEGTVCTEDGFCANTTSDCAEDCADSECVSGVCVAVLPDPYIEDLPETTGLYNALARTASGLALVFYDRSNGSLYGAAWDGSAWGAPFAIDGFVTGNPGDNGLGASLTVDAAGAWHVTYVDGAEEELRYARVEGGAVTARELVDDGSTDGTDRHPDGRHIVGDDSTVVVTDAGELRVAYQDATAQRLMFARRAGDGTWGTEILDMGDSTGYFAEQVLVGSTSFVATWWRYEEMGDRRNGVRVFVAE